jgi:hypothetical protein
MRLGLAMAACAMLAQACAQLAGSAWADSLQAYWGRIDAEYRDPAHSPLLPEDRARFTALERFGPDERCRMLAVFKARKGRPFGMKTSTERLPQYEAVGRLRFFLFGTCQQLTVYRNIDLSRKPGFEDYLFVPFTDATNGEETYGGGRYLDLRAPLGRQVELDFNRAYNPYCAYGGRYSCPIPPAENHLAVPVRAGVKAFAH